MAAKKRIKKPTEGNTHWKNLFPQDYLGSHNLLPDEELVVKITSIGKEDVPRKKKTKGEKDKENLPILFFEGKVPKMVLKKTNGKTIEKLYGPYTDKWIGKTVQIFATNVNAFGEEVSALRVRDFVPEDTENKLDVSKKLKEMKALKTLGDLQAYFTTLPKDIMRNPEVVALKDELKASLSEHAGN